jgi:putative endonuclease
MLRRLRGSRAERRALRHLTRHGLRCLARNVRTAAGELDLIMADGPIIVFVEVRSKHDDAWGPAAATVDGRKQDRLKRAAALYLAHRHLHEHMVRFDVVAVDGESISWLPDAFSPA